MRPAKPTNNPLSPDGLTREEIMALHERAMAEPEPRPTPEPDPSPTPEPATEKDLSDEILRQLPLVMAIGEILQPTEPILNRVLTDMITAYEAGELDDFNSKINLELNLILKQSGKLTDYVHSEYKDENVGDTAPYLILLLREKKVISTRA